MHTSSFVAVVSALATFALSSPIPARDSGSSWTNKTWADLVITAPVQGRYLHRNLSGDPFMWVADTNWELFHRMNRTDIDLYLADRAAKGFNAIMGVAASKLNATTIPNFSGELVFENDDPATPNDKYFDFVDFVVERAAEYGILVCILPTWGRYVNNGWYGKIGPILFNDSNAEAYGYYLGKRYPGIPKILGGDSNTWWADNVPEARAAWQANKSVDPFSVLDPVTDTRHVWAAMLRGLQRGEAEHSYDTFAVYHPTGAWITGTPKAYGHNMLNGSYGRVSVDAIQSGHQTPSDDLYTNLTLLTIFDATKNYEYITEMRSQFSGPVVDIENHYEGAHHDFVLSTPVWNASHVRHGFYSAVFSGACGYTYGALSTEQSYENASNVASPSQYTTPQLNLDANASWHEDLHLPGAAQAGYVARLFASLPRAQFDALEPARDLLSSPSDASADVLAFDGDRYVSGIATTGHFWAYAGHGDTFQLDLTAVAQRWGLPVGTTVHAQWFNPRTAKLADVDGVLAASGSKVFVPPTSGGVDHDWVLVVKATSVC